MTDDGRRITDNVGLCLTCRWVRHVRNRRGSTFFRCTRAEADTRFVPYPALPVLRCDGFEAGGGNRTEPGTHDVTP